MIDEMTRKPLTVSTDGTVGPYIMVEVSRLSELCGLLDQHRIRYSVQELAISIDDGPETTIVDLGRGGDAPAVQAILDGAR